ncbi:MAG: ParA family protein [Lachnospiraceae bacterium]|nr:ParA family protein [Lachnospiraceae bacterium]
MGKIIAVSNQKGGVGKSTTAINVSDCMAAKGKKILVVDMDPQGNTTSGLGVSKADLESSVYDLLSGRKEAKDVVLKTDFENLFLIPSNEDLAGAEIELMDEENRETRLKEALSSAKKTYDRIIIDCPPSLSLLTINALTAADSVLIPIQCEYYALEGLTQMLNTTELIRERLNEKLRVEGIVFTMYDARTRLSQEVVQTVKDNLDVKIFKTVIPRNVRLAEAPSYGMPVNRYDRSSTGAIAYRKLSKEILKAGKEK